MDAKTAIKYSMAMSIMVVKRYLEDLSDADLMRRPPGCNHLAWQLGHLISSEVGLLEGVGATAIELPAGFKEAHAKEQTGSDDPTKFLTKQGYLDLFDKVRGATIVALDSMPDTKLDEPSPERMRSFFPTVGHMFTLIANHPMMHCGQFAVVRRQLGKPVVI